MAEVSTTELCVPLVSSPVQWQRGSCLGIGDPMSGLALMWAQRLWIRFPGSPFVMNKLVN